MITSWELPSWSVDDPPALDVRLVVSYSIIATTSWLRGTMECHGDIDIVSTILVKDHLIHRGKDWIVVMQYMLRPTHCYKPLTSCKWR